VRPHQCHAIGCQKAVEPRFFMCLPHWQSLPKNHQEAIWASYRKGQENSKAPSLRYLVAQTQAVLAVATIDGRSVEELERQRALVEWAKGKLEKYG
jgi:hypothetical protein